MTWMPPTRRGPPWVRLGLAGALVVACGLAGLGMTCVDMPGSDLVALAALLVVQGTTALGSFVTGAIAVLKRDWPRARKEAVVGIAMLCTIPLAAWTLFSLVPDCAC
jgi:hypothetical protein